MVFKDYSNLVSLIAFLANSLCLYISTIPPYRLVVGSTTTLLKLHYIQSYSVSANKTWII